MALLLPLIIIFIAVGFFFSGDIRENLDDFALNLRPFNVESSSREEQAPTTQNNYSPSILPPSTLQQGTPPTSSSAPSFILDTAITGGPSEGEVFSTTDVITFQFSGSTVPYNTEGNITFETYIDGIDIDWVPTSSSSRQITIPAGSRNYTFLVRSKLRGAIDFTPVARNFSINVSPYFDKIRITGMSPSAEDPDGSRFSLSLRPTLSQEEQVNITGWKLESRWTGGFTIPKAISKFHPARSTQNINPIVLTNATSVDISGESGPVGNEINFKTNGCFGYLQEFFPDLPGGSSCSRDAPSISEIAHLTPSCQDFILSEINYSGCESIDYSNNIKIASDVACKNYLSTTLPVLNYDTCYSAKSNDSDFVESTWYIYSNRRFGHYLHDVITLFDSNGLIVDEYTY